MKDDRSSVNFVRGQVRDSKHAAAQTARVPNGKYRIPSLTITEQQPSAESTDSEIKPKNWPRRKER